MERKNNNAGSFYLTLTLAIKTLCYSVVCGALLFVLLFVTFPEIAEDFYAMAGSAKISYQFAEKATRYNESTSRLIKTADKAIALMEKDSAYAFDVEKYCSKLLLRADSKEIFSAIDENNLNNAPKEWHVNLYDSADYYSLSLYKSRLSRGVTDFFFNGKDVSITDLKKFVSERNEPSYDDAYFVGQVALYVEYRYNSSQSCNLDDSGFLEYYSRGLEAIAQEIDVNEPKIELLFRLKAFYRFYNVYEDKNADFGKVDGFDNCENVKTLYENCFKKYCENK